MAEKRDITEGLIKELNALLLFGITHTQAVNPCGQRIKKKASPGQYKRQPNHVLQADGTIHAYVDPLAVADHMAKLVLWLTENKSQHHPIIIAALTHHHLVRIHAFDDGNGRGARILMNLILMQHGRFPAVIRTETKRAYLDALKRADSGDLLPFALFVAQALIETQQNVINDLQTR